MNSYEKIRDICKRCHNCNSSQKLEVHHRIFRSELEQGVIDNIKKNSEIYRSSYGLSLGTWGMHDVQNLVVLCALCHNKKIHGGDEKLRKFYRDSFTEPSTMFNISFQKPMYNLF